MIKSDRNFRGRMSLKPLPRKSFLCRMRELINTKQEVHKKSSCDHLFSNKIENKIAFVYKLPKKVPSLKQINLFPTSKTGPFAYIKPAKGDDQNL